MVVILLRATGTMAGNAAEFSTRRATSTGNSPTCLDGSTRRVWLSTRPAPSSIFGCDPAIATTTLATFTGQATGASGSDPGIHSRSVLATAMIRYSRITTGVAGGTT